jgi:hypothetical protein
MVPILAETFKAARGDFSTLLNEFAKAQRNLSKP